MAVNSIETYRNIGLATTADNAIKANKQELGQEQFLKLLTTQMTHQDPGKPMENGDFLAQMAQFSTVEGVGSLNDSFKEFAGSVSSGQALQAASLVGKSVMIASDQGRLSLTDKLSGEVVLNNRTDNLQINFLDSSGEIVKTLNLGQQEKGNISFEWDGQLDDGTSVDPGTYSMTAEAKIEGVNTALEMLVSADVESVALGHSNKGITLTLENLGKVNFNEVKKIF